MRATASRVNAAVERETTSCEDAVHTFDILEVGIELFRAELRIQVLECRHVGALVRGCLHVAALLGPPFIPAVVRVIAAPPLANPL